MSCGCPTREAWAPLAEAAARALKDSGCGVVVVLGIVHVPGIAQGLDHAVHVTAALSCDGRDSAAVVRNLLELAHRQAQAVEPIHSRPAGGQA